MQDRYKVIPAVYLIFRQDTSILFLRRYNTGYRDGEYSLPAGHVEKDEGALRAVIREAQEELGVVVQEKDISFVHALHRSHDNKDGLHDRIDLFFAVSYWQGDIVNNEPEKCDDLLWVDLQNIPENTLPFVRYALEQIQNEAYFSVWEFPVV